ncbi:ATP-dependent DNA helicase [Aquibacillus rhizosphaerae]|uniref:AAA family ATPase n=1 Tax=Aquibacillus rhizosphaerae TaxID=3051431 RepID=A0ABT7L2Y8_9BACI|nr:AAA family ATPase [Aquibacillus sp. LR5S19]MDL4840212.1 AAA family ATPase [Aquibacillus sp. LR5S19]
MSSSSISLTDSQKQAVHKVEKWYKTPANQVFVFAGYAGTGKTTCVHYLLDYLNINYQRVAFVSPTGKASLVLTENSGGKYQGTTIHKLIYKVDEYVGFILKEKAELASYDLIICDEASMISKEVLHDLLSFDVKVLFLGDRGQLDPVGDRNDILENPDVELTEIHRQAKDNPIIYLSGRIRAGEKIKPGKYGENAVVFDKKQIDLKSEIFINLAARASQVLCGKNDTRNFLNQSIRRNLGIEDHLPVDGEKLICLRNNWNQSIDGTSLVNGMTGLAQNIDYHVKKDKMIQKVCLRMKFKPDFLDKAFENILLLHSDFENKREILYREEVNLYDKFDFGYAITTHKSQGSQYENVLIYNEVLNYKNDAKWLYTAITRATNNVILIQ